MRINVLLCFCEAAGGTFKRRSINHWKLKRERHVFSMLGLIKQGQVDKAEEVFDKLIERKVRPDVVAFNAMLSGYALRNDLKKAFKCFNNLKKRGLIPTDRTYSTMYSICAKMGHKGKDILVKLQDDMERRQVILNTAATNSYLNALVHCGQPDEVFTKCVDILEPSIETYSTLLMACSKSNLEKLESIWKEMSSAKLKPQLYCFNALLASLRDGDIPDHMTTESSHVTSIPKVTKPLKAQRELRLCLNEDFTLTLYISGSLRWLEVGDIEKILSEIKRCRLSPDIRLCTLLISLSIDVYYLLKHSSASIDETFIKTTISRLKTLKDSEGVQVLLDTAHELGFIQDNYYIEKAKYCYNRERTKALLEEIRNKDEDIQKLIYELLIKKSIQRGDYSLAVSLLKDMKYAEYTPSSSMLEYLETATMTDISEKRKWKIHGFNGLKGFYKLWKDTRRTE